MRRAKPMTDEQFNELLRASDPFADGGPAALDREAERLLQRILSSERVISTAPIGTRGWRWSRVILGTASAAGVIGVAVAAVLVFTASDGPSVAFAGWRAEPTVPGNGQVQAAETECERNSTLASLIPVLADTRGPYTLLVYGQDGGGLCMTGPSIHAPTPSFFGEVVTRAHAATRHSASRRPAARKPTETPAQIRARFRVIAKQVEEGSANQSETPPPPSVAANAIQPVVKAVVVIPSSTSNTRYSVGRVGEHVTSVTVVLKDGERIIATTAGGWYAAWWPEGGEAQTAQITTTSGVTTQKLVP
jgi:hypothetical protein